MTVGERIRAARIGCQMTQKELGERCGIAEPTIRRYELGKLNPKLATIERIAVALGVPAAELVGLSEEKRQEQPELPDISPNAEMNVEQKRVKKLLKFFSMLNDKGQQEAIKRLDELSQLSVYQLQPIPPEYKIIGKRIKMAREKKQLTYNQLGEMCQLSAEDVLNIELGNKIIPLHALKKLNVALDIRITDLLILMPEEQERANQCYDGLEMLEGLKKDPAVNNSIPMYECEQARIQGELGNIIEKAIKRMQMDEYGS